MGPEPSALVRASFTRQSLDKAPWGTAWLCHGAVLSGDTGLRMTDGAGMPCLQKGVNPTSLLQRGALSWAVPGPEEHFKDEMRMTKCGLGMGRLQV